MRDQVHLCCCKHPERVVVRMKRRGMGSGRGGLFMRFLRRFGEKVKGSGKRYGKVQRQQNKRIQGDE